MRWAITSHGVGQPVGYRPLATNDSRLADGETFITTIDPEGKVLANDGASLRAASAGERLADAKAAKWAEIKQARQAALDAGVVWNGHRWDTEEDDINRIARTLTSWQRALALPPQLQAQLPGPVPTTVSWTTQNDEEVMLTVAELAMLDAVISLHVGTVFGLAKQLRSRIHAAGSLAAVDAITWSSGP